MTLQELLDWHHSKARKASEWANKHRNMNKHGRAYHDMQATKHQLVHDMHEGAIKIMERHAGITA